MLVFPCLQATEFTYDREADEIWYFCRKTVCMLPYLQAENLSKRYGDLLLFENVSFTVNQDRKVALIARNGAGKSSLFDLLAGKEAPDAGKITWTNGIRLGYLEQSPSLNPENTVLAEIFDVETEQMRAVREYERALAHNDQAAVVAASAAMDLLGAWDTEAQVRQILSRLRITDLDARVGELSGGQQKRLGLAKVLVRQPDFLLLDEPTNHLDLDMVEWLENYLRRTNATLLMVTHDRYFLDRVCDEILELDDNEIIRYRGNYSLFLQKREERLQVKEATLNRARNLLRTEMEWMRRMPKARSHKSRYRVEGFYELREKAKQPPSDKSIGLNVRSARLGKKILEIRNLSKSYGEVTLVSDFTYSFSRYEKVGIVGNNGTGKTTFLDLVTGLRKPDSGRADPGSTIRFGYYRQEGIQFNPREKVLDAVHKIAEYLLFEDGTRMTASQMLTHFLFPPSTQHDYIEKLSGGEKRRLYLCTVLMQNPNFLLLDEPTNDFDILTLNVLEEYLQAFEGCLVVVSHDRFFMDKIVDHLFVFDGKGSIRDFPGNYTQYRDSPDEVPSPAQAGRKEMRPVKERPAGKEEGNKLTFKEKRELEQLEAEIGFLEARKRELEELLSSGTIDHEALFASSLEIGRLGQELEEKELRWLELSDREG